LSELSDSRKLAEIIITSELTLEPFFCESYEQALEEIDSYRKSRHHVPSVNLVIRIRPSVGSSKLELEKFLHQLNLDQIEYHVYW